MRRKKHMKKHSLRCECSRKPKCKCRCHGRLHGVIQQLKLDDYIPDLEAEYERHKCKPVFATNPLEGIWGT